MIGPWREAGITGWKGNGNAWFRTYCSGANDPDYFPGPSVWRTPAHKNGGGLLSLRWRFPTTGAEPQLFIVGAAGMAIMTALLCCLKKS